MKQLHYDAVNGEAIPVGLLRERLKEFIDDESRQNWIVSSECVISCLRLMIKNKEIPHDLVLVFSYGTPIIINETGKQKNWPAGFGGHYETIWAKLI